MQQKVKKQQGVHVLTEKVCMRFIPLNKSVRDSQQRRQQKSHTPSNNSGSGIWRYISYLSNSKYAQKLQKMLGNTKIMKNEQEKVTKQQIPSSESHSLNQKEEKRQKLKYALRLSPEHILLGNQYQLDVFYININSNNYVQTQYLWSITKKSKITHVCLEEKKINLLVVIAQKQVSIYRYDAKKFPNSLISPLKYINLNEIPIFAQIVKDGNICLFFSDHVEVFVLNEGVRRRYNGKYELPQSKLSRYQLFLVPEHYDNYVNVFFQQKTASQATFTLWCIEMEFMSVEIKCYPIQKIYQIKRSFKNMIRLTNYSKQIFLLNLGNEILALKRGYILDSASVTMNTQQSLLEYLANGTLCHISPKRIQVYKFSVNISVKPSKILVKSQDSIKIQGIQLDQQYFKMLPILNNDFVVIFQKKPQFNFKRNGQIQYSLYITRKMSREEKMKQLFPKNLREFKIDDQKLLQKCNIAEKMGYTIKQIYLQLWQRSAQSNKSDYSLLIATRDYNTITEEIVKKLKKSSLHFRQILNIEQACIQMLKEKVFSSSCTFDIVMNYINSHFFIRKLLMFRDIQIMEKMLKEEEQGKQHNEALKMTIRQYQFYKNMQIKAYLIECVRQFCQEGNKQLVKHIRFLLRNFKFVFRTIYQQILQDIIINANQKLLLLLKEIPEILPYQPVQYDRPAHVPSGYYDGVWAEITKQQWKQSLYVDALVTIDNKFVVCEEVIKSIPFKRNWLSQHDMITESIEKIKKIQEQLRSPHIFYFFIAKLFQHAQDRDSFVLKGIVSYLQDTYTWENQSLRKSQMPDQSLRKSSSSSRKQQIPQSKIPGIPENVIGKVFLLQKIYRFFHQKKILPLIDNRLISLSQFFDYSDPQLIRYCFQKERSIKGLLLRDIKDIYKQCLPFNHNQVFNKALLNYFISDLSEVSDLKYLLNRINNEKKQFHKENKEMYAVLIEALERKLKIGTNNDIPIDQVLIYLQNIPLHTSYSESEINKTLQQLRIVEIINKESQFLRQSKINMSIYEILRNPEEVFTKLIDFAVNQSCPQVWESSESFQQFAVAKLVQVQEFSSNIYNNRDPQNIKNYDSTIFFIFLAKVCEDINNIKYVRQLLSHQDIQRYEHFTAQGLAQGLVQFMYKWTLYQNNSFLDNFQYIKELLTLISQNSSTSKFIENELEFAKLLSFRRNQITYPITDSIIGIYDIKSIVNALPINFVQKIPIQRVFETVKNIQQVISEEKEENCKQDSIIPEYSQMDPRSKVTLYQVYQIFIVKYLNQGKIKQCIPLAKKILELPNDGNERYDIIYPILFIMQISNQLNESNKENLIKCVWFYFYQPKKLMQILEYILLTPLSPHQMKIEIEDALERGKQKYKGYNQKNPAFSHEYLQQAKLSEQNEQKLMKILSKTSKHLQQCKQQFKSIKYSMIMAMLCNSPYALAKFIFCNDEKTVRPIRSILSYAILQEVFESLNLLEIGRRVFIIILQSFKKEYPIESVIKEYEMMDINEDIDVFEYNPPDEAKTFQSVMWKSAEAFHKKKMALIMDRQSGSRISKKQERIKQKRQKISQIFENAELSAKSGEPSEYIFSDSDNEDNASDQITENIARSKFESTFVPKDERNAILRSTKFNKPCALYKSAQADYKFNNRLFVTSSQGFSNLTKGSNLQVSYSGRKSSLRESKYKSKEEIQKVPLLRISISHPQISQAQDGYSRMNQKQEQAPQSPVKSIPSFENGMVKISSFGNQELQQQFNIVTRSQQYSAQKKDPRSQSQRSGQSIYQIQNYELPLNSPDKSPDESPDKSCEKISNLSEKQLSKQNSYHIKISEVKDVQDEWVSEQMPHKNQIISYQKIADQLFEDNKNIPFKQQHKLSVIEQFHNNQKILKQIVKKIYQIHVSQSTCHKALKLLEKIIEKQSCLHINSEMFKLFLKIHQVQSKTIPEIPLSSLVTGQILCKYYSQERQVFEDIYQNLRKFVGSQNIYTITQFVRRVFDDPTYDQQIIWDFLLDLCEKIDSNQGEQKNWNLEKIQVTFPKVDISICISKFNTFKSKVLEPDCRDQLLQIFCQEIKIRTNKQQSIVFLGKILQVYRSEKVLQTLSQLKSEQ